MNPSQSFMGLNYRALAISSVVAGIVIGLLSNIPLVACVNCLLLAWVWGGGIFAVLLYRKNAGQMFLTIPQGLVVGAVAGVIGALVGLVVALIFSGLSAVVSDMIAASMGDTANNIPSFLFSGGIGFIGGLGSIFIYAIMGAVGGLIATALIWKAPTAPVAPPPPYTPPPSNPNM